MTAEETKDGRLNGPSQAEPVVSALRASVPDAVYHDIFGSWADVQREFSTDAPEPFCVLYANYSYEDYSGDAEVIWLNEDLSFGFVSGGHCSCYGLEDQWEPEQYTPEQMAEMMQRDHWVFRSHCSWLEPIVAQAIEARRAETGTGSVHESAVLQDAPKACSEDTTHDH